MTGARWTRRPEGSNWGEFGPGDTRGRMNLLTPERVRAAAAEVREGISHALSLPLTLPGGNALNPNRFPPALRPTRRFGEINFNYRLGQRVEGATDVLCDDLVVLHLQYSTQWDSFAHAGALFDADGDGVPEPVFYNGFRAGEDVVGPSEPADSGTGDLHERTTSSGGPLGIDNLARSGAQGRGVLIDLHRHLGDERAVVGYDTLAEIMAADGVEVEEGDMVCLHTGFAQRLIDMDGDPDPDVLHGACPALDGRDERLLRWITDAGLSALIADNYAVEQYPATPAEPPAPALPLHHHCLFKLGVHLGELWHLTPLAADLHRLHRSRFLLTAPPLNLPGAVGSPTTPVATL
ncbi:cyclase family protein [Saccharopolyspora sp. TS4A08]|uniref:Cyclase family protein n=1 Tax=Saccharopolyspora ipomoeae TaxID=3042027 RepID=A0ABT6PIM9_9PSEU|nr:cyclase family protein [Saccharopolyspora sp. TS4A08]MDI2027857.1 cyclase family protein [Saccharopolyspora sp. TS4A08]